MKGLTINKRANQSRSGSILAMLTGWMVMSAFLILTACNTGSRQESADDTSGQTGAETTDATTTRTARATMEAASGSEVSGEATFTQQGENAVRFQLTVQNLPAGGVHAVHLHEKGDCSAEDASSAGGHWNPTMQPHGKRGEGAYHKGDVDNMTADSNGQGTLDLVIEGWTIGGPDSTNILDKSVIIHAKPDDFTSQPSGNAGDRISCGVIEEG